MSNPYDVMLCLLAIAVGVGLVGDVVAQWRLTATAQPNNTLNSIHDKE